MALATSACRERQARSARIQASSSITSAAERSRRAPSRSAAPRPLISRSTAKIASMPLTAYAETPDQAGLRGQVSSPQWTKHKARGGDIISQSQAGF
jgi:hypothetical protein